VAQTAVSQPFPVLLDLIMDATSLIPVLSRFIHVSTAVVLVGGITAIRYVVAPVLANHPEQMEAIRQRWKKFVHGGIGLFLLSGGYNYLAARADHSGDGAYHGMVGFKMVLALVVFFLASALVGRSAGTQKYRDNAARWKTVIILLAFCIIGISSFVKIRGVPVSAPAATDAAVTAPE
jgi:uncharacterized membrane protein